MNKKLACPLAQSRSVYPLPFQSTSKPSITTEQDSSPGSPDTEETSSAVRYTAEMVEHLKEAKDVDILLTHDWPLGVVRYCEALVPQASPRGTQALSALVTRLAPRYHFASSGPKYWERPPFRHATKPQVTRFYNLGPVLGPEKERWFYAMTLLPMRGLDPSIMASQPPDATDSPFEAVGGGEGADNFFFTAGKRGVKGSTGGRGEGRERGPPPSTYVCRLCHVPGHWIQDCSMAGQNQPKEERTTEEGTMTQEGGKRRRLEAPRKKPVGPCWFCLSSPDVAKHLILSIGEEAYLTIPKGGLIPWDESSSSGSEDRGSSLPITIPGGGHLLLAPIEHVPSFSPSSHPELAHETTMWLKAVRSMYAQYECVPLTFEVYRQPPLGKEDTLHHGHLQVRACVCI